MSSVLQERPHNVYTDDDPPSSKQLKSDAPHTDDPPSSKRLKSDAPPLPPNTALHSLKGKRGYQEDRAIVQQHAVKGSKKASGREYVLSSVFDGHGGAGCSDWCSNEMPKILTAMLTKGLHPVEVSFACTAI